MTNAQVSQLYKNMGWQVPEEFKTGEDKVLDSRKHKYNATKKAVDGIVFDSSSEADAYRILKLWESAGVILNLKLQPKFILQEKFAVDVEGEKKKTHRAVKYIADFQFETPNSNRFMSPVVVVDVKGIQTPAFRIKEKLFRQKFPELDLQIWDREKVRGLKRA